MSRGPRRRDRVLVVRQDAAGDMLLAGPCVRAVAAGTGSVTVLAGPRGRSAAALLPGVDAILERAAPWIEPDPAPVEQCPGPISSVITDSDGSRPSLAGSVPNP